MINLGTLEEISSFKLPEVGNNLEQLEQENVELLFSIFQSLKLRDAVKVSNYFSDFASLDSMEDSIPPVIGREAILAYFRNVFAINDEIEFELACAPVAFGNVVLVKQISHFVKDGIQHKDLYVNSVFIFNGKINKWIAHLQQA